ncbi:MAG: ribbon-helix-helix protein, CopG family [Gemmatimonadetes bacterium]|nr:ribbon-helix-helix protein, CopG family [Gemmatimonadota bacterium]
MAIPMIKATYTLDPDTVRALEAMARRLGVSKSEALRRAIGSAAKAQGPDPRVAALARLRKRLALTPEAADAWVHEAKQLRLDGDRVERIWRTEPPPQRVAESPPRRHK